MAHRISTLAKKNIHSIFSIYICVKITTYLATQSLCCYVHIWMQEYWGGKPQGKMSRELRRKRPVDYSVVPLPGADISVLYINWLLKYTLEHTWLFAENNMQIGHSCCLSPNYLAPEQAGVKEVILSVISVNPHAQIPNDSLPLPHIPFSVKTPLALVDYLMAPLPVPALPSALQSSEMAALSLFRVPRTDTASTWDMPKSLSIRVLLLSWQWDINACP